MNADTLPNLLIEIDRIENDCLKRIFMRYMLRESVLGQLSEVKRMDFDDKKNYWEYWHNDYFLMNRELKIVDGEPVLVVNYNPLLVNNNEL